MSLSGVIKQLSCVFCLTAVSLLAFNGSAFAQVVLPGFAKLFDPAQIQAGGISTIDFAIENTSNGVAVTLLDFTDNLPAGVVVASPPNATTTCTGGTLTAVAGAGTITYTGGTVPGNLGCGVFVDVTSATDGTYVNTSGDLTSSAGNSGPAISTLTVTAVPLLSPTSVPTMTQYALVLLGGMLISIAFVSLRKSASARSR